ncbi:MAG: CsbD family protein [Nitrospirae bacterium]|nr:CsbD family protein [Nitrospirota bacterium]
MNSSTKDKVKGMYHEAEGKVKEMAGKITGNSDLEIKGKVEKSAGKSQEKLGEIKKVMGS